MLKKGFFLKPKNEALSCNYSFLSLREKKEEEEEWDDDVEKEDEDAAVQKKKPSILRIGAHLSKVFTLLFNYLSFIVQNEDDDWQENEELRAIEGLEGEPDGGPMGGPMGGPRGGPRGGPLCT